MVRLYILESHVHALSNQTHTCSMDLYSIKAIRNGFSQYQKHQNASDLSFQLEHLQGTLFHDS